MCVTEGVEVKKQSAFLALLDKLIDGFYRIAYGVFCFWHYFTLANFEAWPRFDLDAFSDL